MGQTPEKRLDSHPLDPTDISFKYCNHRGSNVRSASIPVLCLTAVSVALVGSSTGEKPNNSYVSVAQWLSGQISNAELNPFFQSVTIPDKSLKYVSERWRIVLITILALFNGERIYVEKKAENNSEITIPNGTIPSLRLRNFARASKLLLENKNNRQSNTILDSYSHFFIDCWNCSRVIKSPISNLNSNVINDILSVVMQSLMIVFIKLEDIPCLVSDNQMLGSVISTISKSLDWISWSQYLQRLGHFSLTNFSISNKVISLEIPNFKLSENSSIDKKFISNINDIFKTYGVEVNYVTAITSLLLSDDISPADISKFTAKNGINIENLDKYENYISYIVVLSLASVAKYAKPIPVKFNKDTKEYRNDNKFEFWNDLTDNDIFTLYNLINRPDILLQALNDLNLITDYRWRTMTADFKRLCNPTAIENITSPIDGTEFSDGTFPALKFNLDYRISECRKLLQSCGNYQYFTAAISSEGDFTNDQQLALTLLAKKVYSLPCGRAALTFSSSAPLATESVMTDPIVVCARLPPMNVDVYLETQRLPVDYSHWPEFHNGVASGLKIPKESIGINSSWIIYNRPLDANNADFIDSRHAGFLLALGLNGQLKKLNLVDLVDYMNHQYGFSALAIILGLAVANAGECDQRLSRLCYVHMETDIPKSFDGPSGELMQAISALSIGLLYMHSKDRAHLKRLFGILEKNSIEDRTVQCETTILSSAFGIVFILLDKSFDFEPDDYDESTQALRDLCITERLLIYSFESTNESLICAGLVALGLIYQRTENSFISKKLALPQSIGDILAIKPNVLLVKTIAYCLVMWNDVVPDINWVYHVIPKVIRENLPAVFKKLFKNLSGENKNTRSDINILNELSGNSKSGEHINYTSFYLDIITGILFVMGIKYAGSHNKKALDLYMFVYDSLVFELKQSANSELKSAQSRLNHSLLRLRSATILQSMTVITAGSGNIEIMKRIWERSLRSSIVFAPSATYGEHLCIHQSLGFLFLGGGLYTFNSDRPQDVASLFLALYPIYPQMSTSNTPHIQAYRHLWAMACKPNTILTLDSETGKLSTTRLSGIVVANKNDASEFDKRQDKYGIVECDAPLIVPTDVDYFKVDLGLSKVIKSKNEHKRTRSFDSENDLDFDSRINSGNGQRVLKLEQNQFNRLYVNGNNSLSNSTIKYNGSTDASLLDLVVPNSSVNNNGISKMWSLISNQTIKSIILLDSKIAKNQRLKFSSKMNDVIVKNESQDNAIIRSQILGYTASLIDILRVGMASIYDIYSNEDRVIFSTYAKDQTYKFLLTIKVQIGKLQNLFLIFLKYRNEPNLLNDVRFQIIRYLRSIKDWTNVSNYFSEKAFSGKGELIPKDVFIQTIFLLEEIVLSINDFTITNVWLED